MTRTARCAAVFAALAILLPWRAVAQERLLVMPFENVRREAATFWLGEAAAVLYAGAIASIFLAKHFSSPGCSPG